MFAATIETTFEICSYWLERDWERVPGLTEFSLQPGNLGRFDADYGVRWRGATAVGQIYLAETTPGRVHFEARQLRPVEEEVTLPDGQTITARQRFDLRLVEWLLWRFEDAVTVLDDDAASKAEPPAKMFGPAPAEIAGHLFQQGLTKDTGDWWLALLSWAKEYRRAYGEKSLTNEHLWTIADVSETTFYRRQKAFGGKGDSQ